MIMANPGDRIRLVPHYGTTIPSLVGVGPKQPRLARRRCATFCWRAHDIRTSLYLGVVSQGSFAVAIPAAPPAIIADPLDQFLPSPQVPPLSSSTRYGGFAVRDGPVFWMFRDNHPVPNGEAEELPLLVRLLLELDLPDVPDHGFQHGLRQCDLSKRLGWTGLAFVSFFSFLAGFVGGSILIFRRATISMSSPCR